VASNDPLGDVRTAALLDVDGTLVASNAAHAQAWSEILREYGYEIAPQRIRCWIGMGGDKLLERVDAALKPDSAKAKAIQADRMALFLERYVPQLGPTPGARALLQRLGQTQIARVIATSAKSRELEALLDAAGIADSIDAATTADDAERTKPDADIITSALDKARVAAQRATLIGDTPYDVEAASRAGVAAIGVRCGGWDDSGLRGAAEIYDDPADLLAHFSGSRLCRAGNRLRTN
jgi:HAD superfamily hydrolase (TIGR01509 family)